MDTIAFQTNILVLNLAVESARVDKQGQGFAVVASEARSLAQRASEAAKELRTHIGFNVEHVVSGCHLVKQAGATMMKIATSVHMVNAVIAEISAETTRQSEDIEQVSQAIGQLDGLTQQKAALIEQSTAAAASLEDQAKRLRLVAALFRLEKSDLALTT